MKRTSIFALGALLLASCGGNDANQDLVLNDLEYFERQGVNVLVYSNTFSGGFNDEKNSGIEIIHHGVRTVQGGAVRLSNTPEQWDLVPASPSRVVNKENKSIEVALRYNDYDFDSRVVVTAQGKLLCLCQCVGPAFDKDFHLIVKFAGFLSFCHCSHDDTDVFRFYAFDNLFQSGAFFLVLYFCRNVNLVLERH